MRGEYSPLIARTITARALSEALAIVIFLQLRFSLAGSSSNNVY